MGNSGLYDLELREAAGEIVRTPNGKTVDIKEVRKMQHEPAETHKKLVEGFKRLGLTDAEAETAAGPAVDPHDRSAPAEERMFEDFKRMGLSEGSARIAAKGR